MLRHNLSRSIRFLRISRGWRQQDLADRASVSREMVSRLERGRVETLTLRVIDRLAAALEAGVNVDVRWQGAQLDRLLDAGHAVIQEQAVKGLRDFGWPTHAEVSFNWYGDRGRCDAVAFHPPTRTLLIVEVKTQIGDIQDLLGRLDVKVRLGSQIAAQLGHPAPTRVVPCLVVADTSTSRRVVATHASLFARFTHRGRAAHRWLADPTVSDDVKGLLWFLSLPNSHSVTTKRRVRARKAPSAHRV
jgi:transcriptional regulator with XRE-family HTH domain